MQELLESRQMFDGDTWEDATDVVFDTVTAAEIETAGDVDWFAFEAEEGATYTIATELDSLPDSTLELYDQDGETSLADDDDGGTGLASLITWTATGDGEYYIQASAYHSQQTGTYSLTVEETPASVYDDDDGDTWEDATDVVFDTVTAAEIETAGDVDWFAFEAEEGATYTISTELDSLLDSTLELYDQDGETSLADDDDGGTGLASLITWTATGDGGYFIQASAYNSQQTGTYSLTVVETLTSVDDDDDNGNNWEAATDVVFDTVTAAEIATAGDVDWFAFEAELGATYTISTELDSLLDSTLELYDQDGETSLADDDDGGTGLASLITWTATGDGGYFIQASAYNSQQTGTYSLTVVETLTSVDDDDDGDEDEDEDDTLT